MKAVKKRQGKTSKKTKESMLKKLPKLLEKDEVFKAQMITLFKPYFAEADKTEDRFLLLLEEIREMKRESEKRWNEATNKLDEHSKRLEEHSKILQEQNKRLEEHSKILQEQNKRLEEHSKILQEQSKRLEEHSKILQEQSKRLEEHSKILQEQSKRLEEHSKILQEQSKRLEEHSKILQEQSKRLEEHSKRLELITEELIKLRKRQDVQIGAIGARWGIKAERSFRNAVKGILEDSFPIRVERYEATDLEGEVFTTNPGSIVELDLIIRNGEIIVAEIKSSISFADVEIFERKVKFFEKREGRRVTKKIVISPMVDAKALQFCEKLGIKVYTDIPEEEEELL